MITANPVYLLASPFGRGVTQWRDGEGVTVNCRLVGVFSLAFAFAL
ncbi:MAG: hypothetical protein FWH14_07885 [Oscillospiraceae bacterium]|nr:hypothetical protein [Oscillospiraceae bacterium]